MLGYAVCPWFKDRNRVEAEHGTVVVLGSGGHTAEMLSLIKNLDRRYFSPVHFVIADTDQTSLSKVMKFVETKEINANTINIHRIIRSREVGQSWLSTIGTTLLASIQSFMLILRIKPNLILSNGPGTCIPICLAGFTLRVLRIKDTTLIFVESFCRVNTLSLSGKLLYPFVDRFVVQWEELAQLTSYPRCEYIGAIF